MRRRRGHSKALDFDDVRRLALALPGMEESTMYGTPALKVNGHLVTCMAINKSAEPGTLVVRADFPDRDELIAADPDTYYLTDHYVGYTSVLVRLSRIHPDALRDLLQGAWRFMSAKPPAKKKTTARARRATR